MQTPSYSTHITNGTVSAVTSGDEVVPIDEDLVIDVLLSYIIRNVSLIFRTSVASQIPILDTTTS